MAANASLPSSEEITAKLREWTARYTVPGAALAWMHDGHIESGAAGVINITTGVEVTPDTLFQIGSITKVYTASLIMQFVEEGRLDLDTPVVTYLPELRFDDESGRQGITLRQLLSHTSGLDGDLYDDFGRGDDCIARLVAAAHNLPHQFAPGTMHSYCNAGFVILGSVVEMLTGMTWDAALKTRLLDPLGVTHTVTLPEEALRFRTAAGHGFNQELQLQLAPIWSMPRAMGPAGGTPCATVADLLAFAKMHMDGGLAQDGQRILSESSVRSMQEVQYSFPKAPWEQADHWGLGWELFDWAGHRVIGHDGGTVGQLSTLRAVPGQGFAVACLTNGSPTGGLLLNRATRWLFGQFGIEMPPRPVPPATPVEFDLSPYPGEYEQLGAIIEIKRDESGALTIKAHANGPIPGPSLELPPNKLIPVEPGLFLERNPYLQTYSPVRFTGFESRQAEYFIGSRIARRIDWTKAPGGSTT